MYEEKDTQYIVRGFAKWKTKLTELNYGDSGIEYVFASDLTDKKIFMVGPTAVYEDTPMVAKSMRAPILDILKIIRHEECVPYMLAKWKYPRFDDATGQELYLFRGYWEDYKIANFPVTYPDVSFHVNDSNNAPGPDNTLNGIADRHYAWLQEMGWTKANALESLALIASEVGEAVNECRGDRPTENFGVELCDIILRTVGLAKHHGIDLNATIQAKMDTNAKNGTRGRKI